MVPLCEAGAVGVFPSRPANNLLLVRGVVILGALVPSSVFLWGFFVLFFELLGRRPALKNSCL